jgi:TonB family protein
MRRICSSTLLLCLTAFFAACSKKASESATAETPAPGTDPAPAVVAPPPGENEEVGFSLSGSNAPASDVAAAPGGTTSPQAESTIERGRWLLEMPPFYPFSLRMQGVEGQVAVRAVINTNGRVDQAQVIASSEPRFNEYALACIRASRVIPPKENGKPIPVVNDFAVTFQSEFGTGDARGNSPLSRFSLFDGTYYMTGADGRLSPAELREPVVLVAVHPLVPDSLRDATSFRANAKISVSAEGQVTSVAVSDATNDDFKKAVEEVLPFWQFIPRMKAGKPAATTVEIPIVGPAKTAASAK